MDKSIDFDIYIDKATGMITGNPYTLEELYSNLLLNAVKYTPPGGRIELNIKSRQNHFVTEISDSGIGIPKEDLTKVFDEFYRGREAVACKIAGTGLGLAIAKKIVQAHRGYLEVTSERHKGSTFRVLLPAAERRLA